MQNTRRNWILRILAFFMSLIVAFVMMRRVGNTTLDRFLENKSGGVQRTLRRALSIGDTDSERARRRQRLDQIQQGKIDDLKERGVPPFEGDAFSQQVIDTLGLSEEQQALISQSWEKTHVRFRQELGSRLSLVSEGEDGSAEYRVKAFPEVAKELEAQFISEVQPVVGTAVADLASTMFNYQGFKFLDLGRSDLSFSITRRRGEELDSGSPWNIKVESYVPESGLKIFVGKKAGFGYSAPSNIFIENCGIFEQSDLHTEVSAHGGR